jgi:ABC-2 type transport system ATP-binding protein
VITARGLRKTFGTKVAVDGLSFDIRPGVVTGFLGPNGAGKSTTMRLMLGLDMGEGTTTFDGKPFVELADPMREVGAMLEAKSFHPSRTARNHLAMLAAGAGVPNSRVDAVLAQVGLTEVAGKRPGGFSLGMAQRLGLAAALLGDPKVLILDEPANGLDPQGINWLRQLLKHLAAQGRTVLVSSHLLSEMALTADHLLVVGRGRLIADLPTAEFIDSATRSTVIVRSPRATELAEVLQRAGLSPTPGENGAISVGNATLEQVGEAAGAAGIVLHELSRHTASLEDAFLEATAGSEEYVASAAVPPRSDGGPPQLGHPGPAPTDEVR